ncbi:hypothetical protein FRC11_014626 [Ceratobasidium sp. 423]|nr:hypothetical protein FRC11_014626 [Ceratobasidium sp. 423]
MRATEDAAPKSVPAGQSSAASTPMPVTPDTPSTTSFAPHNSSSLHCATEQPFEPSLFEMDFSAMGLGALPLPIIAEVDPATPADIAIDPELLALSNNPGYIQNPAVPQNFDNLEVDLAELFNALPPEPDNTIPTNASVPALEPLAVDPSINWDALADLPFEDLLATWASEEQCLPAVDPQNSAHTFPPAFPAAQQSTRLTIPISDQGPKQQTHCSRTVRIPARAEALALLERAQARKKELEEKLLAAKRQLWGCRIEAGVERNLLEALKKAR